MKSRRPTPQSRFSWFADARASLCPGGAQDISRGPASLRAQPPGNRPKNRAPWRGVGFDSLIVVPGPAPRRGARLILALTGGGVLRTGPRLISAAPSGLGVCGRDGFPEGTPGGAGEGGFGVGETMNPDPGVSTRPPASGSIMSRLTCEPVAVNRTVASELPINLPAVPQCHEKKLVPHRVELVNHAIISHAQSISVSSFHAIVREIAQSSAHLIDSILKAFLEIGRKSEISLVEPVGTDLGGRPQAPWLVHGRCTRTRPAPRSALPTSISALNSSVNSSRSSRTFSSHSRSSSCSHGVRLRTARSTWWRLLTVVRYSTQGYSQGISQFMPWRASSRSDWRIAASNSWVNVNPSSNISSSQSRTSLSSSGENLANSISICSTRLMRGVCHRTQEISTRHDHRRHVSCRRIGPVARDSSVGFQACEDDEVERAREARSPFQARIRWERKRRANIESLEKRLSELDSLTERLTELEVADSAEAKKSLNSGEDSYER